MLNNDILPEAEDPLGCIESDHVAELFSQRVSISNIVQNEKRNTQERSLSKNGLSKSLFANPKTHSFRRKFFPGIRQSQWNDWHWQMKNRITNLKALERIITLSDEERRALGSSATALPFSITPYYASLIDRENSLQPIRRTVVPVENEHFHCKGEQADPLGEDNHSPVPGLIHRYPDRVLFLATSTCSTYCRYCTRSRMVGDRMDSGLNTSKWQAAINYISQNSQIRDVVISGGDPLMLADEQLELILIQLKRIPHLEMIRIGTKAPVVLPQRITPALIRMLKRYHPLFISIHFTHPDELTPETMLACIRLADAGIPLGSQTVLLKGINDEAKTLKRLFQGLLKIRVRPYYLYQCDPIPGSGHFRTPVEKGLEMIRSLRGFTSGYAVPAYVIDAPGGGGKIPMLPDYVVRRESESLVLRNYKNLEFRYPLSTDRDLPEMPDQQEIRYLQKNLVVGLTYDQKKPDLEMGYQEEETVGFDLPDTIHAIENALQELGFDTDRIGDITSLSSRIANGDRWDMVFNISDGLKGFGREAQIPALLEANSIPYVFSDPMVLSLTQHKGMTKHVIRDLGIPTPDFLVVNKEMNGHPVTLPFPLFAKPVAEVNGKRINGFSRITRVEELHEICRGLLKSYKQPVLVEKYLQGREFKVGIIGSGDQARSIGVLEVIFKNNFQPDDCLCENKQKTEKLVSYRMADDDLAHQASQIALQAWQGLGCRDAGRIDIRTDERGIPNFIAVNPMDGLTPNHSDLCIIARLTGLSYTQLIDAIMKSAMERYQLHQCIPKMELPQREYAHA